MDEYEQQSEHALKTKILESKPSVKPSKTFRLLGIVLLVIVAVVLSTWLLVSAPSNTFPVQLEITSGMTAQDIAAKAAEEKLVRSEFALYAALSLFHDPTNIHAGRYVFTEPMSVIAVAEQIASNKAALDLIRVTFPEGITIEEMAEIAASSSESIEYGVYLQAAAGEEGYLFPETYFIPPSMTAAELVSLQRATFDEIVEPLLSDAAMPLEDIVILASIVEREANSEDSMRTVAGIFQNRLDIGMALQADASIEYVLDSDLNDLPAGQLATELRELDSPYNTYLYPGLPPTPIGNPGYTAIMSVINPISSEYFYYITASDGTFYYAETLDGHNTNIANYLLE